MYRKAGGLEHAANMPTTEPKRTLASFLVVLLECASSDILCDVKEPRMHIGDETSSRDSFPVASRTGSIALVPARVNYPRCQMLPHPYIWDVDLYRQLSHTGCPKKHGHSVTNSISSLLWISILIPNFKSHNSIKSARVYFMKRVKDCKDVSIMSPQDEQWIRTSLLCLYTVIFLFY